MNIRSRILAGTLSAVPLCACSGGGGSAPAVLVAVATATANPSPTATPLLSVANATMITHVVVIMQENRSFDNLFNGFPGADTVSQGTDTAGVTIPLTEGSLVVNYDLGHDLPSFNLDVAGGKMNGWNQEARQALPGSTVPPNFAYQFTNPAELVPYWQLAQKYSLADRMFSSSNNGSFSSHLYMISGQSDNVVNTPTNASALVWGCDSPAGTTTETINDVTGVVSLGPFPCLTYPTVANNLDAKGITWKYYAPTIGTNGALWSIFDAISPIRYGPDWTRNVSSPETTILSDIANGNLAQVSWVVPSASNSDHPSACTLSGPSWVASVVSAVGASPYWANTAIFVSWDDWGGFYDHVVPPKYDAQGLGIRVPLIVVSPYAKHGYVSHVVHETDSTLRFIEERFGLPSLGGADARADDLIDMFDFSQNVTPLAKISQPVRAVDVINASRTDQNRNVPPDSD